MANCDEKRTSLIHVQRSHSRAITDDSSSQTFQGYMPDITIAISVLHWYPNSPNDKIPLNTVGQLATQRIASSEMPRDYISQGMIPREYACLRTVRDAKEHLWRQRAAFETFVNHTNFHGMELISLSMSYNPGFRRTF